MFDRRGIISPLVNDYSSTLVNRRRFKYGLPVSNVEYVTFSQFGLQRQLRAMFARGTAPLFIGLQRKFGPLPRFPVVRVTRHVIADPLVIQVKEELPMAYSQVVFFSRLEGYRGVLIFGLFPCGFQVNQVLPVVDQLPIPIRPNVRTFIVSAPRDGAYVVTRTTCIVGHFPTGVLRRVTFYQGRTTDGRRVLPSRGTLLVA